MREYRYIFGPVPSRRPGRSLGVDLIPYLPEVRREALQAHIVKVSLSAWDQASYGWVNRPHPALDFKQVIGGQEAFRNEFKGELWIEVFLVEGMNSIPSDVAKIAALADLIKPDRIHLNTAVRPPGRGLPLQAQGSLTLLLP